MGTRRRAEVVWEGGLTDGVGTITSTASGAIGDLPVTWKARAEEPGGPEELIAAAHAACFSMALSGALAGAGTPPERLDVGATATFVPGTGMTTMELAVRGRVPGIDPDGFRRAAEEAKDGCPVSQALAGKVDIPFRR